MLRRIYLKAQRSALLLHNLIFHNRYARASGEFLKRKHATAMSTPHPRPTRPP